MAIAEAVRQIGVTQQTFYLHCQLNLTKYECGRIHAVQAVISRAYSFQR
jgi:hypothetical protein